MTITDLNLDGCTLFKRGKVRHVYDAGDELVFVATDRVSAFDYILPNGIPDKGKLLTEVSVFWFNQIPTHFKHHLITDDVSQFPAEFQAHRALLEGRSMLVKKTELIEIECVVRGYLAGSGWKEYQESGTVCGHKLPAGLRLADPLPEPIFTPAIKAADGHDENVSIERMKEIIGEDLSAQLIDKSMALYAYGKAHADERGIILADTKFEFGLLNGEIILIDEVLTSDSSRYWPKADYKPGISPPSFDKQIVRDYLESTDWDKASPPPVLPDEVVRHVRERYMEFYERITSQV